MKKLAFCETMSDINENYVSEAHASQTKKKPIWVKWGAMAACLAIVAFAAVTFFPHTEQPDITPPDTSDPAASSTSGIDTPAPENSTIFIVNQLQQPPLLADMDVEITHYDKLPNDVWQTVADAFESFTGISYDDFLSRLPAELQENVMFCSLATRGYQDNAVTNEYYLHDYIFSCRSNKGTEATIAICSFDEPLRDCLIYDETPERSSIHGTPATIYEHNGMYMVQFTYNEANYDITTTGMDLEQLEQLLLNIIV